MDYRYQYIAISFKILFPTQYQNQRGGRVCLAAIDAPGCQEWKGALHGLEVALALKRKVNEVRG